MFPRNGEASPSKRGHFPTSEPWVYQSWIPRHSQKRGPLNKKRIALSKYVFLSSKILAFPFGFPFNHSHLEQQIPVEFRIRTSSFPLHLI